MSKTFSRYLNYICDYIDKMERNCYATVCGCDLDDNQYNDYFDHRDNYCGLSECERELLEMAGE